MNEYENINENGNVHEIGHERVNENAHVNANET